MENQRQAYNELMFKHLTNLNRNKWKKEIRKDVIGLKGWKNKRLITAGLKNCG